MLHLPLTEMKSWLNDPLERDLLNRFYLSIGRGRGGGEEEHSSGVMSPLTH